MFRGHLPFEIGSHRALALSRLINNYATGPRRNTPQASGSFCNYALRKAAVPGLQNNIDAPRSLMVSNDKGCF
jgi:hypothetical protein